MGVVHRSVVINDPGHLTLLDDLKWPRSLITTGLGPPTGWGRSHKGERKGAAVSTERRLDAPGPARHSR